MVFGTPYSHENDPERAVRASLEIMKSIEKNGEIEINDHKIRLKARIGINTGLCISGEIGSPSRKEFTVIGDAVNLASRLQNNVDPGCISVGEKTYQRTKKDFIYSQPYKLKIKGKSDLVISHILKDIQIAAKYGEMSEEIIYSPFIGRKKELNILRYLLKKSLQSKGQVIKIIGELGAGKSRLISELLKDKLIKNFHRFSTDCSSWEQSKPYTPLHQIFYKIFQLKDKDNIKTIEEKVKDIINKVDSSLLYAVPYFSRLLSSQITPLEELMGKSKDELNLFAKAAIKLFCSLSNQKPILIIIEDIQWIDDASLEFINSLSREIVELPIFLICSLRKSLQEIEILPKIKSLELLSLTKKESIRLIKSLTKDEKFPELIYKNIFSTSAGNPLFIEEITRNIKLKKSVDLSHLQIPDTVQSIVSSRIDLLPIGYKEILYQAAVMGKNFEFSLLQKLTDVKNEQLLKVLQELKKSEFIFEKKTFPTQYFSFKRSIIQEVAYNNLLYKTRRRLHSQLGFTMEEAFSNVSEIKVEELAYHFKNSNHQEKAIFYLNRAGDKAQSLFAFKNAIKFYQDCINILEKIELEREQITQLSDIYNKLAFSQSVIGERKEAEINLNKALEYCKKINDKELESLIIMHIGNLNGDTGQWDKAIEYFQSCLSIIKGTAKLKRKARILKSIGLANLFKGNTSIGYS